MKIYYDDDGLIDPMDKAKERRIEQLKSYDLGQAILDSFPQDVVATFAPHCPNCLEPTNRERIRYCCRRCGSYFERKAALMLRKLTPCPAPPYTQAEVNQLCAPSC